MPLYEYFCPHCGEYTEVMIHHSEEHKVVCGCGDKMQRVVSAPNFKIEGFRSKKGVDNKNYE